MEVIFAILLCALGLFLYLTDKNNKKILKQNEEIRELREKERQARDLLSKRPQPIREIERIREVIVEKPIIIVQQTPSNPSQQRVLLTEERFVSVIFKKGDKRRYDYFLGNNYDIKVDDFVVVPVHDKFSDRNTIKIAKVKYISAPGEISRKAKSTVIRKADYRKW